MGSPVPSHSLEPRSVRACVRACEGGGDPLSFGLPYPLLVSEEVKRFDRQAAFFSCASVSWARTVGEGWGWEGRREARLGMSPFYFWCPPHLLLSSLLLCLPLLLPPLLEGEWLPTLEPGTPSSPGPGFLGVEEREDSLLR